MNYKSLAWILRIVGFLAFLGVLYFVFFTAPYREQEITNLAIRNIIIFEVILFIFLSTIFSLFLFWIRRIGQKGRMKNPEMVVLEVISIRQGILLGFCAMILLILQSFNILTWWDGLLAVGAILMLELYFLVK